MTKISLTPVIDVVFILLIFFMLASNFNKVGEISMDMSEQQSSVSKQEIKIIKLEILEDEIVSEGKRFSLKDIPQVINSSIDITDEHVVVLTSNEKVSYSRLMNVIEYLELNDVKNLNIGIQKNENK